MYKSNIFSNPILFTLLCITIFVRIIFFGNIPYGINCDEAYAGYEAFSILTTSKDSWEKFLPIYLITGGGGTNALYSYLTIPFIKMFGLSSSTIRLPQIIFSLISCYVFYKTLKIIYNKKIALMGLFIIAITPWHIIMSRWGFHGNIAPSFLLISFYFYIKSFNKIPYIYISMIFFALTLYTYDPIIGYIGLSLPFLIIYLFFTTANTTNKIHIILSSLIFLILAIPEILLLYINTYNKEEIITPYFTIPRLLGWRGNEINISNITENFLILSKLLITQTDNMIWNTLPPYGLFYPISHIFFILGIYCTIKNIKQNKFNLLLLILFVIGIIYSTTFNPASSNRINYLFYPILTFITIGLYYISHKTILFYISVFAYSIYFIFFCYSYFNNYNTLAKNNFSHGFKDALAFASNKHSETSLSINLLSNESDTIKILFYNQISPKDYHQTVTWRNYPSNYLTADSFLHYKFYTPYDDINISPNNIYIAPNYLRSYFGNLASVNNFAIKAFDNYIVVYPYN